jgi:NhaP-type Na+/H+ or K+/H+ antiporter
VPGSYPVSCDGAGLPPLLGMILAGVALGNWVLPLLPPGNVLPALPTVSPHLRVAVLAIVLLRAGLGLSRADLGAAGSLALRLGLVPMLVEALAVAGAATALGGLPWGSALALGFLVAAISPAIVIPEMLELLHRRHGAARRVPAALLAGAPLDNIAAVVALGTTLDLALDHDASWLQALWRVPYAVGSALAVGALAGLVLAWLLGHVGRGKSPLLWIGALALVPLCKAISASFVIAIVTLGLTAQARSPALAETCAAGLSRMWRWAQVLLFALIGAALDIRPLAEVGLVALAAIVVGMVARAGGAWIATAGAGLSWRERAACALCYLPKATIQAAFGALVLDRGMVAGQLLLSTAVLAIAITAPLGVLAIHRFADRLLPRSE